MSARSAATKKRSKRDQTDGSTASSAERGSASTKKAKSSTPAEDLAAATRPLLALFAVCDDVFTEEDALSPEHMRKTIGRIYEEYKRTRKYFDPDFHVQDHLRPRSARRGVRIADRG